MIIKIKVNGFSGIELMMILIMIVIVIGISLVVILIIQTLQGKLGKIMSLVMVLYWKMRDF